VTLRRLLPLLLAWTLCPAAMAVDYPPVRPDTALVFPRDHGAHPDFRTEWWYATGWLEIRDGPERGRPLGFQVTFFRSRPGLGESGASRFSPRQLLFAHAALSDPGRGRLLHDQRAARAGFGLAQADARDTDLRIDAWSLTRGGDGTYRARIPAREFTLELDLRPTQQLLPQGEAGFSRKGPRPGQASHYYSQPHLAVSGRVIRAGRPADVSGTAWLDHEWSTEILAGKAVGWDWVGLNLDDGSALMAFRIRDPAGNSLWAGGTLRGRDGQRRTLEPGEVAFRPLRRWRSPLTGIDYPVAMAVRAGDLRLELRPLLDDQELDSRTSTGAIYWEGAVTALKEGRRMGRGYLELTGYGRPLEF
jgi:predicted secreted hydrolase